MAYVKGFLDKDGNVIPKKKQPLYQRVGNLLVLAAPAVLPAVHTALHRKHCKTCHLLLFKLL